MNQTEKIDLGLENYIIDQFPTQAISASLSKGLQAIQQAHDATNGTHLTCLSLPFHVRL